ncbi:Crp/Fnr family transcriptional regulator [Brevibacillus fulvus]|uniref:CRP/FNR family transcriptional regulator n=1 Tax=Brevibacillus fulvus TaxID=1125967 RepID=A0A938Y1C2_9BACL|nr:CRP/FNR family transcriptional regulator [Brevibacillus fulvus]
MIEKAATFARQISPVFLQELHALGTNVTYCKHDVLFLDGDTARYIYLLAESRVKLTKTTLDGKELTLEVCGEGDLVGVCGLFEPELHYTSTAVMLSSGPVFVIARDNLEKFLLQNSLFLAEFLRWMGMMNRRMQSKFRDLLLHGKQGALYSTLIRMCNTYGVPNEDGICINLPMTNRELAQFIGLTRESVNRMLAELKNQNVIDLLPQGYILVKDLAYLKETIHCDQCQPEICQL